MNAPVLLALNAIEREARLSHCSRGGGYETHAIAGNCSAPHCNYGTPPHGFINHGAGKAGA
jgi:hypothetical protein